MSDIYNMPGHLIRRLQQLSASVFAEHVKAQGYDLTSPQYAALSMIELHPRIDQATLAGLIAFDRPTIGGVVDRLVGKGYVKRDTNPADRRARVLTLTPTGVETLRHLRPIVVQSQTEILPGLTEEERGEFIRLAAKIAAAGNDRTRAPLRLITPPHG